jgi:hypothetical protein
MNFSTFSAQIYTRKVKGAGMEQQRDGNYNHATMIVCRNRHNNKSHINSSALGTQSYDNKEGLPGIKINEQRSFIIAVALLNKPFLVPSS